MPFFSASNFAPGTVSDVLADGMLGVSFKFAYYRSKTRLEYQNSLRIESSYVDPLLRKLVTIQLLLSLAEK